MGGWHPELARRARWLPRYDVGPRLVRATRWIYGAFPEARSDAQVEVRRADLGGVRAWVFRPRDRVGALPALLWLHGGGYVLGTPLQDAERCRRLARALGIVVVAPRYRLAPEHPHPAALDDAYAALVAMADPASGLGVRPDRIAVLGVSAGGGLAAALALRARDRGGPALVHQSLVYPMLDDRTAERTDLDERFVRVWTAGSNRFAWCAYLRDGAEGAVPARATSLAGLPPAWIGVGTADLFHDEDVAYAERLRASGVPCTLELVPGAYHGFDATTPRAEVSRAFLASRDRALGAALLG